MASVKSSGVHLPSGLPYAIDSDILPADPPPSSYTWEYFIDSADGQEREDELLTTETSVIWSRGGSMRRIFSFDLEKEPITQALLTYFPTSEGSEATPSEDNKSKDTGKKAKDKGKKKEHQQLQGLSRALVVFLKTQAHIHFLSGTSYVVHMPFEVESACAAPCGVIIQRKLKADNLAPVSLRFPRVPPNSFVSSQPFATSQNRITQTMTFSTEGLGKPRTLPLRLSATLENMWQPTLESTDSHWPRLVCLTDPLQELGLVVTHQDRPKAAGPRRSSMKSPFLDPAEEILHLEPIRLPAHDKKGQDDSAIIAVTVNRESSMYTVWKMAYIQNDDPFISHQKKAGRRESTRRRSSMPPGLISEANTPLQPKLRESFGAPLPGKKPRKNDKPEQPLDALSSLDPDKGGEVTRRQSRRVSSLLARGDLSASQDRTSFAEPPLVPGQNHVGRRVDSRSSLRARASGNLGGLNFSGTFNQNLNVLTEGPVDNLLDELKAGGDFERFHTMGLDDHDFDGLAREILFTKIQSVPMDNANVRYSLSNKPARSQCGVFVLLGSPSTTDEQGRTQLVVGIQDPVDKRLQLLLFYVKGNQGDTSTPDGVTITYGHVRKAQGVVDSCKLTDGDQSMILILSEDSNGQRELSLQAPWCPLTTIALPALLREDLDSLDFLGEYADEDAATRRLAGINGAGININGLRNPQLHGIVDVRDGDGTHHRIRIQLQPNSPQVRKVLDACQSVLPAPYAEKMLATWWHIMQWRARVDPMSTTDLEWSCMAILLFATFLVLGNNANIVPRRHNKNKSVTMSSSPWAAMQNHDTPVSAACPSWMRNNGWQWMLEEGVTEVTNDVDLAATNSNSFVRSHIALANEYLRTHGGSAAFGPHGYLATAAARSPASRRTSAGSIILALHLLVEEQRLDILTCDDVPRSEPYLKVIVAQVCRWLGWEKYAEMYDLSMDAELELSSSFNCDPVQTIPEPPFSYCIYGWIQASLTGEPVGAGAATFLTLPDIFSTATESTQGDHHSRTRIWEAITPRTLMFDRLFRTLQPQRSSRQMVEAMYACGFTTQVLETLPEAILAPLQDAISICQPDPPSTWPSPLLELINRTDVSSVFKSRNHVRTATILATSHQTSWDVQLLCQSTDELSSTTHDEGEATERQAVVRALFKDDRRLNEAQNLLSSQKPRLVKLEPLAAWSESEYLDKQKELANTVATSTLAIPAGRGLLYYALRYPILTQRFHIGGFNLSCVVKPANVTVGVDKSMFTEEKINWAFFHQGVAGGLAISPHAKGIDTSWILYNKPGQDLSNRHAGFLLALGLNGHLKSVAKWVAFKYLTPKHTMTSIGLLLGLAASYIGTMDSLITRLLSVHVTRMLPRGAAELNLSKHVQTTGVMGIGLLYCNSQHRRMSEIMLSEIEHTEDEDEENPLRDEGYRLAAGFALGFINLGKGTDLKGLYDMRLTEKLLTIATATKKVELVHVLDRSSAGAVMAIALIFMKSDDHIVARKIDVPESILQFDYIRPDVLLLRTLAKHLVMWSSIVPSFDFIKANLPREYRHRHRLKQVTKLQSKDLPFFSILAGICFAIALRYAGSGNTHVRDILVYYLDEFIRLVRLPSTLIGVVAFDAEISRSNARMCMDLLALSCATVMAGTGDLTVLRRLRSMHGRAEDTSTTYGSHLASHLAIGALFLGCGTATFGTSDKAIAALLVAFYPLFPATVQDNGVHLQAFRHFWTLAVENRCLVTKDVESGLPVGVPVVIRLNDKENCQTIRKTTPCLLPPLDTIASLRTDAGAMGYWDISIEFAARPEAVDAFRRSQGLYLRRRPALERPFPGTIAALGRRGNIPLEHGVGATEGLDKDPIAWVFGLDGLKGLTHAERGLVMDIVGDGYGEGRNAVDTGLVLGAVLDGAGGGRDGLLGLRLLFAWADARGKLVRDNEGAVEKERKEVRGKGKGKERATRRGKSVDLAATAETDAGPVAGDAWWIRDSVVDMLRGRAWLAGREE